MAENEPMDDVRFAEEILKGLPTTAVPAALSARILADFDRVMAPSRIRLVVGRIGERLWPGAPIWQPASILALSLAIGLMVGAFLPAPVTPLMKADQTIAALDTASEVDLDKDL